MQLQIERRINDCFMKQKEGFYERPADAYEDP